MFDRPAHFSRYCVCPTPEVCAEVDCLACPFGVTKPCPDRVSCRRCAKIQLQVSLALDPRYFALRWFTTLLSREFDLPDTIRLWDSLFAAQDRSTFLVFVFVTLMLAQRETLLAGDFASNLQLLQAYPPTDVPEILAQSEALRLFSARGDAARAGGLAEQRAKEAADGAKQAAEQVNAAARRFWNVASDFAAGAAERVAGLNEGAYMADSSGDGTAEAQGLF